MHEKSTLDPSFGGMQPREHAELKEKVEASMRQGVIQQSLDKLQGLLREQQVEVVELSGRPKNLFSIFKKMQTKVCLHHPVLYYCLCQVAGVFVAAPQGSASYMAPYLHPQAMCAAML